MAHQIESTVCDEHGDAPNQTSYSFQEEESAPGIQFSPPLYLQRYMLAVDYLTKNSIQTVVDFGCSECGFFRLLSTVPSLEEISLVDIDRDLLMTKTRVISPELKDYVHRRTNPLNVFMYFGSAADYDVRMKDYQTVTLIEVIEHLHPDDLESVTCNVFGAIHPIHVIVTTPNSEFNVLFGNDDPKTFRHWDHKFEWTRKQFQTWCHCVCESYGYEVEYSGVGFQPSTKKGSELGPCSQAAFFKQREQEVDGTGSTCHLQQDLECRRVYELIAEAKFPYEDNEMSLEEKLDMEIMYALRQIAYLKVEEEEDRSDDESQGSFCIEVSHIANRNSIKHLASQQEVREYLKQKSFEISENGETVTLTLSQFIDSSSDKDDDDENNFEDNDDVVNDKEENKQYCGHCSPNPVVVGGDVEEFWDT